MGTAPQYHQICMQDYQVNHQTKQHGVQTAAGLGCCVCQSDAVSVLLPGAGLYSCSMLKLSGPKSCQLFTFHIVNKSPMQKIAPCTCTSFTMKPVSSYLRTKSSIQAQQVGDSCNSRTYPSILTRPASATMRSYSSALVASVADCPL